MQIVEWLNRNQGFAMVILTFVYVLTTVGILWRSVQLERNRLRPHVFFHLGARTDKRTTYASVKNTAAYEIQVTIEPKLARIVASEEMQSSLTAHQISYLPPGEEVIDVIDASPAFHQRYPQPVFEGVVRYKHSDSHKYSERFRIDLTYLKRRLSTRDVEPD